MKALVKLCILVLLPLSLFSCPAVEEEPDVYDIRFEPNGGEGYMDPQEVALDDTVQLDVCLFWRYGYQFTGWGTGPSSGVKYLDGDMFTMATEGFTLYAQWAVASYQIWFDPGSDETTGAMLPQAVPYGSSALLNKNAFERDNYHFLGWASYPGGEVVYQDQSVVTMDMEGLYLFAVWEGDPCSIIFYDGSDQAVGTMNPISVPYGSNADIPPCAFTRPGYVFGGWALAADGPSVYGDGQPFLVESSSVSLWATWSPNSFDLLFDANGGAGSMNPQAMPYELPTALSPCAFTNTGYTFSGWASSPGGSPAWSDRATYTMTTEGATLYATWTAGTSFVSFNANGGSGYMAPQAISLGQSAALTAVAFTRTGHSFLGWATSAGGSVSYSNGALYTMNTAGATLYAVWHANNYEVVFNANGGTGTMSPQLIAYGATSVLRANAFSRYGYAFSGWATSSSGAARWLDRDPYVMNSLGATLYAVWTAGAASPSPTIAPSPTPSPSPTPTPTPSGGLIIEVQ